MERDIVFLAQKAIFLRKKVVENIIEALHFTVKSGGITVCS